MINKRCKHIETGHEGTITKELPESGLSSAQWGINWDRGAQVKYFHPFWNDKDKIEIL